MAFDRRLRAVALGLALAGCVQIGAVAARHGWWGLLLGAGMATVWTVAALWRAAAPGRSVIPERRLDARSAGAFARDIPRHQGDVQRLLLDAAPVPMIALQGGTARALNRAARTVFAADDRILSPPAELRDPAAHHLRHEGRTWRIDRVEAPGAKGNLSVVALIDVEREELAAEARASADLIEVLGHELLNGLAPIVSLAESAQHAVHAQALAGGPLGDVLIHEILGPLARRAEGLQRFAQSYRTLARLPEPVPQAVAIGQFIGDLGTAFRDSWPDIALTLSIPPDLRWSMDRDQMNQAMWALLQNAAEAVAQRDGSKVDISVSSEARRLTIAVSDNGVGVAAQSAVLMFRPFHTTKTGGSGIGLSLARQIVRAHGGSLEWKGAAPTRFELFLPGIAADGSRDP